MQLDLTGFAESRGETVQFVADLLAATRARQGQFGCFGLHEWAMVYRLDEDEVRHAGWPLRLGAAGTDAVVEAHQLRCSHFDAFRFYTPPARPLNLLQPTRERQVALEQPGCLHAGMDLYKWAYKLLPCRAERPRHGLLRPGPGRSASWTCAPPPMTSPSSATRRCRSRRRRGRREYAAAQRGFAARGQALRDRLLAALAGLRPEQEVSAPGRRP